MSNNSEVEKELAVFKLVKRKNGKYSVFAFEDVNESSFTAMRKTHKARRDSGENRTVAEMEELKLISQFLELREEIKRVRVEQARRGDSGKGLVNGV